MAAASDASMTVREWRSVHGGRRLERELSAGTARSENPCRRGNLQAHVAVMAEVGRAS